MVDPIGTKAGAVSDRRTVPVAPAGKVAAAPRVVSGQPELHSAATEISVSLAAQPPVDLERVARIRKAVQEGKFPYAPANIADRLLAFRMEWKPNGAA